MISATSRLAHPTPYSSSCHRTATYYLRSYSQNTAGQNDRSASSKLFADAAREEAEEEQPKSSRLTVLENQEDNWTGDESVRDAVLRMLVDKYKPLRSGPIRTADEKLKQAPPKITPTSPSPAITDVHVTTSFDSQSIGGSGVRNLADVPLLPSVEGHQPWHTTFQAPSHATSSIKYGNIISHGRRKPPSAIGPLDEKAEKKEKETKKRMLHAGRISRARESALDYKLGLKATSMHRTPIPATMKGWASLVEEKIEVCS